MTIKEETEKSCGSRAVMASVTNENPRQHRMKLEVYGEVLQRIHETKYEEANFPDFDDQLWLHFHRLPARGVYSVLRRAITEEKVEEIQGLGITVDKQGAVFDVEQSDVDLFLAAAKKNPRSMSMQVITELPKLQQKEPSVNHVVTTEMVGIGLEAEAVEAREGEKSDLKLHTYYAQKDSLLMEVCGIRVWFGSKGTDAILAIVLIRCCKQDQVKKEGRSSKEVYILPSWYDADVYKYNSVISGLCKIGEVIEAAELLDQMITRFETISGSTYDYRK